LGRGLLILGVIMAKITNLGIKKAGVTVSSDFWENCIILNFD
jgi:hypothetical protein